MEFIDLKAISLLKVAEYENFTKAAKELCISQPAISNHIKAVEEELGFKIFERGTSGIHLTEKGAIVIKYISQMNSIAESLKQALASDKLSATALRVGITHTVESSLVVDAIAKYLNKSTPGVSIRITSGTSKSLYKQLKNGEIDFIIMEGSYNDPDLNNVMLGTDSLVLVTSPSNHLASKNTVTLDEMKEENLIMRLPDSNTMKTFASALKERSKSLSDFNIILEIDNIATIKDLIRRDFGVSILAKSVCLDEVRKGKLAILNIENISMVREMNLVYPKDFEHAEAIDGIVRCYNEL
ncbi:MAG: LysR family transcriptional regulator [Spirochaetales bacterium]|nr:LysR family transcriptional regulator [Spirochaetales bacterium]